MNPPDNLTYHSNVVCWDDNGNHLLSVGGFINPSINNMKSIFFPSEGRGVNTIIDLMTPNEHVKYGSIADNTVDTHQHVKIISFPIMPKKVPKLESLISLVDRIVDGIKSGKLSVYIQSVYGCGRANLVACFILSRLVSIRDSNYIIVAVRDRFSTRVSSPKKKFIDSNAMIEFISNNL